MMLPNGDVVPMSEAARKVVLTDVAGMARGALRTLALAVRLDAGPLADYGGETTQASRSLLEDQAGYAALESSLCFIGVVGLFDPPRPEVGSAILQCRGETSALKRKHCFSQMSHFNTHVEGWYLWASRH